jgi:hypothetical protein
MRGAHLERSSVIVFVLTAPDRLQTLIENGHISQSRHFKDKQVESLQDAVEIIKDLILDRVTPVLAARQPSIELSRDQDFLVCNCRDVRSVQAVAQECFGRFKALHPKVEGGQGSPVADKTA